MVERESVLAQSRAPSRGPEETPSRGRTRDKGKLKDVASVREREDSADEGKDSGGRWKEFRKGALGSEFLLLIR